jgi:hypothetical protein
MPPADAATHPAADDPAATPEPEAADTDDPKPALITRPLIHDPRAPTPPTPPYAKRVRRRSTAPAPGLNEWFSTRPADVPAAIAPPAAAPPTAAPPATTAHEPATVPVVPDATPPGAAVEPPAVPTPSFVSAIQLPVPAAQASSAAPAGAVLAAPAAVTPGRASLLSDLPFDAPDSLAAWVGTVGLAVLAVAFVLPWADAPGLAWLDSWGLRDVSYALVFLLVVATLISALTPSRLPERVRLGYLPALVGALALGLLVDVPVAAPAIGVWLFAAGALLATAGGLWLLVTGDRRAQLL